MSTYLIRVAVFVLAAGTMAAQSAGNWNNVKSLAPGATVRVAADSRTLTGKLQSVSDESLVLALAGGQEMFARQQITRVSEKKVRKLRRNTLIGLAIGAGAGLVAGAIMDSQTKNDLIFGPNFAKGVLTTVGAIVGTITGLGWPTGGWRDVYK